MNLLFMLVSAHALCDFALQPEAMGKGKSRSRNRDNPGNPDSDFFPPWYAWLSAHALIHGGAVALLIDSWGVGLLEAMLHGAIDHAKCEGRISFNQDQALHLACKLAYVLLFF
jgi:hypothetical protein